MHIYAGLLTVTLYQSNHAPCRSPCLTLALVTKYTMCTETECLQLDFENQCKLDYVAQAYVFPYVPKM